MDRLGTVLVTGATGFIAAHIVARLLEAGADVRGTVRSLAKRAEIDILRALPGAGHRLELFEADLTRAGSFDEASRGCRGIIHAASPYVLDVNDPQKDLVDPALEGTREVLQAAQRAGSVTRVVLTSSMAAITDEPEHDRVLTERDWNVKSSLTRNPYYYSKVLAERAAWDFVERNRPVFDLVAMNPFMVIGPSLTPALNQSNALFVRLLEGSFPAVLSMAWALVDVRDVADAHVRALGTPAAHGRYICAGEVMTMRALVHLLREQGYSGYRLPTLPLDSAFGTWIARLASYRQPKGSGRYLRTHLGRVPRYDTTKIRTELGVSFRPAAESVLDTMANLERWGHLPARSSPASQSPGSR
jgi:dihydroflavonol-4-reductase